MMRRSATRVVMSALLVLGSLPALSQEVGEPYAVSVWARVLFGTDGKPQTYSLVEAGKYPAKFVDNILSRVSRASIRPPMVDGRPVTLSTAVEFRLTVTPSGDSGTVRVDGVAMGPLPVRKTLAKYPDDIGQTGGWEGAASAVCTVGPEGRCISIEVNALPGMPQSVRRYMRESLGQWEFEPQQIDGRPIEGEYRLNVRFKTLDGSVEDFRQDKFIRLLNGRQDSGGAF